MKVSQGSPQFLGARYDGMGTNFCLYSSIAERVELCLLDDSGAERRFDMPGHTGFHWHARMESVKPGTRYGFRVHGPWNPSLGHLCCPQKLLLDPYARAVEGSVEWSAALFPYDPEQPDSPANRLDSSPYVPKSIVVASSFDWEDDKPPATSLADTITYEVHVKGFTQLNPRIPEELRGTYLGLAHPVSIKHFKRLGITAVELLPVQQFVHRHRLEELGLRNYWGYDPVCLFAPHSEYASGKVPGSVVDEFKGMVKTLHAAGIQVILDVVFNHTAEGGGDGGFLSFKGLDNAAYYRLATEDGLQYVDWTGTQNTLNTENSDVRVMIIDALRYWVEEMHVDGFRFDLAPVLAREGASFDYHSGLMAAIRDDPVLGGIKFIAEPWDLGPDGYQLGRFPQNWSEWNDRYRDDLRDYWNGRRDSAKRFMLRVEGSPDIFGCAKRPAAASVNFVTCHDGVTLQDLVSYQQKHNEANGEDNRDGHSDDHAWNIGVEGPSDDVFVQTIRDRQKRNFIATLLLSFGLPMINGGDELGRTQSGNNNAYCQDNEVSWFDWDRADTELVDFVSAMVFLRKELLKLEDGKPAAFSDEVRYSWFDAMGAEFGESGVGDEARTPLQAWFRVVESEDGAPEVGASPTRISRCRLLFNPSCERIMFQEPAPCRMSAWSVAIDTAVDPVHSEGLQQAAGESVSLHPHSLVVLVERA